MTAHIENMQNEKEKSPRRRKYVAPFKIIRPSSRCFYGVSFYDKGPHNAP